jgi:hypothetical protein
MTRFPFHVWRSVEPRHSVPPTGPGRAVSFQEGFRVLTRKPAFQTEKCRWEWKVQDDVELSGILLKCVQRQASWYGPEKRKAPEKRRTGHIQTQTQTPGWTDTPKMHQTRRNPGLTPGFLTSGSKFNDKFPRRSIGAGEMSGPSVEEGGNMQFSTVILSLFSCTTYFVKKFGEMTCSVVQFLTRPLQKVESLWASFAVQTWTKWTISSLRCSVSFHLPMKIRPEDTCS